MRHRRDVLDVLSLVDHQQSNFDRLGYIRERTRRYRMEPPGERYILPGGQVTR
jgi:hypothetical protein